MKKILTVFALLLLINLTSCLEMNQEIWVNVDGSGRFKMDIGVDKNVYDQVSNLTKMEKPDAPSSDMFADIIKQKDDISKNPDVSKVDIQQYTKENAVHLVIDVTVKDFQKMSELDKLLDAKDDKGEHKQVTDDSQFTFKKVGDTTFDFGLLLHAKPADNPQMESATQMMQTMFAGKEFVTTLHAPQIISSNGEKVDEHTVRWKMLMTDRLSQKEDKNWQAQIGVSSPGFVQNMIDTVKGWFK